jgi:hypothetical protein
MLDAGPTPDAHTAPDAPSASVVSGTATYEDLVPSESGLQRTGPSSPIRRARVRVVDGAGTTLGSGVTDETGAFSITLATPAPSSAVVEVSASMHDDVVEAYVSTNAGALHTIRTPITGATVSIHASAQVSDGRVAGPFNVLDRVAHLSDFLRAAAPAGTTMPRLVVHWELGSTDGTNAQRNEHTPFGDACVVRLLGRPDVDDDAFDDTVISHEIGHCVAFAFSSYAAPRWRGHTTGIELEAGLALNEGVATFLGQRMSGTPHYIDTRGDTDGFGYDIDAPAASDETLGLYGEAANAGALWDLTDSGAGDDETLSLTPEQFWTVFHQDVRDGVFKSIQTYFDGVVAHGYATDAALDTALGAQLGLHRPMSPTFPLGMLTPGAPQAGTVDATQGAHVDARPLAAAIDDWGFELAAGGTVHLALTNVGAMNDLDLYLEDTERNGIATSDATGTGDESIDATLAAGRYVVVVRAYEGPQSAAAYSLLLTTP